MLIRFLGNGHRYNIDDFARPIFKLVNAKTLVSAVPLVCKSWSLLLNSDDLKEVKETALLRMRIYAQALRRCVSLSRGTPDNFTLDILQGGLTNCTYKIQLGKKPYVIRFAGAATDRFINRSNEKYNTTITSSKKISPKVYLCDEKTGILVTRYLDNAISMTIENFKNSDYIRAAITVLEEIHHLDEQFANDIDIFERNRQFIAIMGEKEIALPQKYNIITEKIADLESLCQDLNLNKVPCTNDATPSNFILSNNKMFAIDLEYSGNNFPDYDFAYWFIEAKYNIEQAHEFYREYLIEMKDINCSIFITMMLVAEYWIALWAYVQIAIDNYSEELINPEIYAQERLDNCITILNSKTFNDACEQLTSEVQQKKKNDAIYAKETSSLFFQMSRPNSKNALQQNTLAKLHL